MEYATRVVVRLSENREQATFSLPGADGSTVGITLTAAQLQRLIQELASARSDMKPNFASSFDGTVKIDRQDLFGRVPDPSWRVPDLLIDGCRVLLLLHPGLGWVLFQLTQENADKIAHYLTVEPDSRLDHPLGNA